VDGETQVYAVLGQPVHHSRSPLIQNAAFRAAGMNAVYVALEVPATRLDQALVGLHAAGVRGLNLTAPHKEAAFSLVRRRTPEAELAGVVNTLRWESTGWAGHSTDGIGFLEWIRESGLVLLGRRVLVLGAGGAARAIVASLALHQPELVQVVSRSAVRAASLARTAGDFVQVASAGLTDKQTSQSSGPNGWDVIIRALPVDTVSDAEERWWLQHKKGAVVLDLNYGDRTECARGLAIDHGLRYEDGEDLLLHQGAASFEFWTGKKAPLDAMREALTAAG